jgi:ethanolamine utilization protein EutA
VLDRLVEALAEVIIASIRQQPATGLTKELLLTAPLAAANPHLVTFSGGVSEYIFERETATYGDIARPLAEKIAQAFTGGRIETPIADPGQGIRATVIGASQFSVQVSGKTIHLSSNIALPLHNVPVIFPALNKDFSPASVVKEIGAALARSGRPEDQPTALAIRWHGDPHYSRLRGLAEGIAQALGGAAGERTPLILMVDGDIGKLLGHILEHELHVARPLISIDGIQLQEFDYVDIGKVIDPAQVVPVVIKSLLFSAG